MIERWEELRWNRREGTDERPNRGWEVCVLWGQTGGQWEVWHKDRDHSSVFGGGLKGGCYDLSLLTTQLVPDSQRGRLDSLESEVLVSWVVSPRYISGTFIQDDRMDHPLSMWQITECPDELLHMLKCVVYRQSWLCGILYQGWVIQKLRMTFTIPIKFIWVNKDATAYEHLSKHLQVEIWWIGDML